VDETNDSGSVGSFEGEHRGDDGQRHVEAAEQRHQPGHLDLEGCGAIMQYRFFFAQCELRQAQFGDLLEAELGLALGDDLADGGCRNLPRLALHLVLDAELPEHLGGDVDAAGAVGIGDGLGRKQRHSDAVA